jgi:hypothetical protein
VSSRRIQTAGEGNFWFSARVPVERARLEIRVPDGFDLEWAAWPKGFAPKETRSAGGKVYVWEKSGLPAAAAEAHSGSGTKDEAMVFHRLRAWPGGAPPLTPKEISRWAAALNLPRAQVTPALQARVAEILGAMPPAEPRARARRLAAWVSQKVRYMAIEVGIGGWRAQHAAFTLDRLYGDCKAKAVLLKAMLEAAEIPSRLAVLHASDQRETYFPISGTGNFNHMVLLVDLPEGVQLFDPTLPNVPFGDVAAVDQDKDLLPLVAEGDELFHLPASPASANGTNTHLALSVGATGSATGKFDLRATGTVAGSVRDALAAMTPEARRAGAGPWTPLSAWTLDTLETLMLVAPEERQPVALAGDLHRTDAFVLRGDFAAFRPADVLSPCFPTPTKGERKTSAVFGPAREDTVEVRLSLPAGWRAAESALAAVTSNRAGSYTLSMKVTDEGLLLTRTCRRDVTTLSPPDYGLFRDLAQAALEAELRPIVLQRSTP